MKHINDFINYISIEKRYSHHTTSNYKKDLTQFNGWLNIPIEETSLETLRKYITHLTNKKLKPRSINRKISCIKSLFNFLKRKDLLTKNPCDFLTLPKIEKSIPYFIDEKTMSKLFIHLERFDGFLGSRNRAIISLLYSTGIRISELYNLKLNDIHFEEEFILIRGKGNKERIIPMIKELKQYLQLYLIDRHELIKSLIEQQQLIANPELFFLTDKGNPTYAQLINHTVKECLIPFKLEKKNPHIFRHTFATHLLNNGANIPAIKELLGHSKLSTTQIYTHTNYNDLKKQHLKAHPRK